MEEVIKSIMFSLEVPKTFLLVIVIKTAAISSLVRAIAHLRGWSWISIEKWSSYI
jgi:hypothetical protein